MVFVHILIFHLASYVHCNLAGYRFVVENFGGLGGS